MVDKPTLTNIEKMSHSIEALESRNAFQDDVIEQLNQELTIHQEQIAELKVQLQLVANRIKDNAADPLSKQEVEPPPPHY